MNSVSDVTSRPDRVSDAGGGAFAVGDLVTDGLGVLGVDVLLRGLAGAALGVGEALDVGEEATVLHGVRAVGAVVPGVDERVGGHRRAVVEGPPVLEGDVPGLALVGRLDGLGHALGGLGRLRVVGDQARVERTQDRDALGLVGVEGRQVLGLTDVGRHDGRPSRPPGAGLAVGRASTRESVVVSPASPSPPSSPLQAVAKRAIAAAAPIRRSVFDRCMCFLLGERTDPVPAIVRSR